MAIVEELARFQLAARSAGTAIVLVNPPAELVDLIRFMGLERTLLAESSGSDPERGQTP